MMGMITHRPPVYHKKGLLSIVLWVYIESAIVKNILKLLDTGRYRLDNPNTNCYNEAI